MDNSIAFTPGRVNNYAVKLSAAYRPLPTAPIHDRMNSFIPFPDVLGTIMLVTGLLLTYASMPRPIGLAEETMTYSAYGVGISIAISLLCDARHGWRNLVRSDTIMILTTFGLLFVEFFFDQHHTQFASASLMIPSIEAAIIAIGVLAIGRHFVAPRVEVHSKIFTTPINPGTMILLFWLIFVIGYLHQWLAVNFNPIEWIYAMGLSRWQQPWGRGMFGTNWKAILHETGLLIHLVVPIGAMIIMRQWKSLSFLNRTAILIAIVITLFYHFTEGTRFKFCAQVLTLLVVLCYFKKLPTIVVLFFFLLSGLVIFVASTHMLAFRQIGAWEYYRNVFAGVRYDTGMGEFFVDMNLLNMARLIEAFPARFDFVGWDVYYFALIRPIPRMLWPGKPVGVLENMTEALKEEGSSLTYSVTWVGEAWMAYGIWGVIGTGLFFGWIAGYWNRFGKVGHSDLGLLIYASGMFCFVVTMRSFLTFTTFAIPTLILVIVTAWIVGQQIPKLVHRFQKREQSPIFSSPDDEKTNPIPGNVMNHDVQTPNVPTEKRFPVFPR